MLKKLEIGNNMIFLYFATDDFASRAKVLTDSITKHHPEAQIVHVKPEVSIPVNGYLPGMAKARLQKALDLLCTTTEDVTIIGADCELFDSIDFDVFFHEHDVALVPHVKRPLPNRDYMAQIYQTGHANADFMVFRNCFNSKRILKWLIEVTEDGNNPGAFYEQTWLSSLPFLYQGVYVIHHPGYNVGYWDVNHSFLAYDREYGEYTVCSVPLVFFQYSGYEKGKPQNMSKHSKEITNSQEVLEFYTRYDGMIEK